MKAVQIKSYTITDDPEITTKLRKENSSNNINDIMGSILHHHQKVSRDPIKPVSITIKMRELMYRGYMGIDIHKVFAQVGYKTLTLKRKKKWTGYITTMQKVNTSSP